MKRYNFSLVFPTYVNFVQNNNKFFKSYPPAVYFRFTQKALLHAHHHPNRNRPYQAQQSTMAVRLDKQR